MHVKDQKTSQEKESNWGFSYNLKGWTSLCTNPQLQVEGIKVQTRVTGGQGEEEGVDWSFAYERTKLRYTD